MVLVSHRYKFIYIKNMKDASTSVEAFFEKYCVDPKLEDKYSGRHVANHQITQHGVIGARMTHSPRWSPHTPAPKIKNMICDNIFNNYFKFAVVRNPWDKMVSFYWHKMF